MKNINRYSRKDMDNLIIKESIPYLQKKTIYSYEDNMKANSIYRGELYILNIKYDDSNPDIKQRKFVIKEAYCYDEPNMSYGTPDGNKQFFLKDIEIPWVQNRYVDSNMKNTKISNSRRYIEFVIPKNDEYTDYILTVNGYDIKLAYQNLVKFYDTRRDEVHFVFDTYEFKREHGYEIFDDSNDGIPFSNLVFKLSIQFIRKTSLENLQRVNLYGKVVSKEDNSFYISLHEQMLGYLTDRFHFSQWLPDKSSENTLYKFADRPTKDSCILKLIETDGNAKILSYFYLFADQFDISPNGIIIDKTKLSTSVITFLTSFADKTERIGNIWDSPNIKEIKIEEIRFLKSHIDFIDNINTFGLFDRNNMSSIESYSPMIKERSISPLVEKEINDFDISNINHLINYDKDFYNQMYRFNPNYNSTNQRNVFFQTLVLDEIIINRNQAISNDYVLDHQDEFKNGNVLVSEDGETIFGTFEFENISGLDVNVDSTKSEKFMGLVNLHIIPKNSNIKYYKVKMDQTDLSDGIISIDTRLKNIEALYTYSGIRVYLYDKNKTMVENGCCILQTPSPDIDMFFDKKLFIDELYEKDELINLSLTKSDNPNDKNGEFIFSDVLSGMTASINVKSPSNAKFYNLYYDGKYLSKSNIEIKYEYKTLSSIFKAKNLQVHFFNTKDSSEPISKHTLRWKLSHRDFNAYCKRADSQYFHSISNEIISHVELVSDKDLVLVRLSNLEDYLSENEYFLNSVLAIGYKRRDYFIKEEKISADANINKNNALYMYPINYPTNGNLYNKNGYVQLCNNEDDKYYTIKLSKKINFYNYSNDKIYVSTNGMIYFQSGKSSYGDNISHTSSNTNYSIAVLGGADLRSSIWYRIFENYVSVIFYYKNYSGSTYHYARVDLYYEGYGYIYYDGVDLVNKGRYQTFIKVDNNNKYILYDRNNNADFNERYNEKAYKWGTNTLNADVFRYMAYNYELPNIPGTSDEVSDSFDIYLNGYFLTSDEFAVVKGDNNGLMNRNTIYFNRPLFYKAKGDYYDLKIERNKIPYTGDGEFPRYIPIEKIEYLSTSSILSESDEKNIGLSVVLVSVDDTYDINRYNCEFYLDRKKIDEKYIFNVCGHRNIIAITGIKDSTLTKDDLIIRQLYQFTNEVRDNLYNKFFNVKKTYIRKSKSDDIISEDIKNMSTSGYILLNETTKYKVYRRNGSTDDVSFHINNIPNGIYFNGIRYNDIIITTNGNIFFRDNITDTILRDCASYSSSIGITQSLTNNSIQLFGNRDLDSKVYLLVKDDKINIIFNSNAHSSSNYAYKYKVVLYTGYRGLSHEGEVYFSNGMSKGMFPPQSYIKINNNDYEMIPELLNTDNDYNEKMKDFYYNQVYIFGSNEENIPNRRQDSFDKYDQLEKILKNNISLITTNKNKKLSNYMLTYYMKFMYYQYNGLSEDDVAPLTNRPSSPMWEYITLSSDKRHINIVSNNIPFNVKIDKYKLWDTAEIDSEGNRQVDIYKLTWIQNPILESYMGTIKSFMLLDTANQKNYREIIHMNGNIDLMDYRNKQVSSTSDLVFPIKDLEIMNYTKNAHWNNLPNDNEVIILNPNDIFICDMSEYSIKKKG